MGNWRERLKAHGEVSRDSLDPYRAAGRGVYDYVLTLDELRAGDTSGSGAQAALLAGWVAFALQVLGDEMLDADAALDPATAHYVPKVTSAQVHEFYEPVQQWMGRASAARANPAYRIDTPLPEVLPEWVEVEPCPQAHLLALRQAVGRLREYTESTVVGFDPGAGQDHARQIVAEGLAEAASAGDYANNMWGSASGPPPAQVHEAIETALKHGAEVYFYLGQVIAMPALADAPKRERETPPEEGGPKSFLETMVRSYPQIAQRPRGSFSGVAGGILGGILGGEIIDQILGGGGGFGGGGFGGGGWGGGGWGGGGPF